MADRTRGGELRSPKCPRCGHRLRVKPQARTVLQQCWQCRECLKTHPPLDCQWSNSGLMLTEFDAAEEVESTDPGEDL